MKALKIGLWVAGGLVVLVGIALAIVAATFDPNKYKPEIVNLVKEKTGRTLAIEGDIGLAFFPKIGATLGKTTLSEPGGAKVFAKVEDARVSLALLPLLSRKVVVDRVQLAGLEVDLVKFKDGRTNFDDLTGADQKPPAAKPAPKAEPTKGAPLDIDVSGIALKNAAIGWRDEAAGTNVRLSSVNLTTGRIASDVPGKLDFSARVQGVQPKMALAVSGAGGYRLNFATNAVALSGLDVKAEGDAPGLAGLTASVKGDVAYDPAGQRVNVAGLQVAAKSKDGLDVSLTAPKLALAPDRSESAAVNADVRLTKSGSAIAAKIVLAAVQAKGESIEFADLAVDLNAKQGDMTTTGRVATPVRVNLGAKQASLTRLAGDLTVAGPTIPNQSMKVALGGAANVDWGKEVVSADLSAKFDATSVQAKVGLADFAKQAITFDVSADRLNVDRYLPPKAKPAAGSGGGAAPAGGGAAKGAGAGGEKPIDLGVLKTLNASGNVRIQSLVASDIKADNVQAALRAAGGRLEVSPLSANLYQGTLAGSAIVNANTNSYAIRQQLNNVSVGPLLRDAMDKDLLEGRGTVLVDVTTTGTTTSALKRALAGSANLNLRDGALKGINLAEIARQARALRSGGVQDMAAVKSEKTDFSELTASFAIKNGVARNDDLAMKSPFVRLGGAGTIDIGASTMDYTAKASIVQTSTGQGGKALADTRGVTIPVKVSGPLDALKYQVDVQSMVVDAAKDEVKRRVEDAVRERLGDKLGDQFKGLFGR
jgi:AsmA protein